MSLSIRERKNSCFAALSLWGLLLLLLALEPRAAVNWFLPTPLLCDLAHAGVFAAFAVIVCLGLTFQRRICALRMAAFAAAAGTLVFCLAFGMLTEGIQFFTPDRTPDWCDLACDMLGSIFGLSLLLIYMRFAPMARLAQARVFQFPKIAFKPQ